MSLMIGQDLKCTIGKPETQIYAHAAKVEGKRDLFCLQHQKSKTFFTNRDVLLLLNEVEFCTSKAVSLTHLRNSRTQVEYDPRYAKRL